MRYCTDATSLVFSVAIPRPVVVVDHLFVVVVVVVVVGVDIGVVDIGVVVGVVRPSHEQ